MVAGQETHRLQNPQAYSERRVSVTSSICVRTLVVAILAFPEYRFLFGSRAMQWATVLLAFGHAEYRMYLISRVMLE